MKLQKMGGYAAILFVCTIVVTIIMAFPMYSRYDLMELEDSFDPVKMMVVIQDASIIYKVLDVFTILLGILFVLVTLALHERMKNKAPHAADLRRVFTK